MSEVEEWPEEEFEEPPPEPPDDDDEADGEEPSMGGALLGLGLLTGSIGLAALVQAVGVAGLGIGAAALGGVVLVIRRVRAGRSGGRSYGPALPVRRARPGAPVLPRLGGGRVSLGRTARLGAGAGVSRLSGRLAGLRSGGVPRARRGRFGLPSGHGMPVPPGARRLARKARRVLDRASALGVPGVGPDPRSGRGRSSRLTASGSPGVPASARRRLRAGVVRARRVRDRLNARDRDWAGAAAETGRLARRAWRWGRDKMRGDGRYERALLDWGSSAWRRLRGQQHEPGPDGTPKEQPESAPKPHPRPQDRPRIKPGGGVPRPIPNQPESTIDKGASMSLIDHLLEAIDATITNFDPANVEDLENFMKRLPEVYERQAAGLQALGERLATEKPFEEMQDHWQQIASGTAALSDWADQLPGLFRLHYAEELARLENPRPGEEFLDVSTQ